MLRKAPRLDCQGPFLSFLRWLTWVTEAVGTKDIHRIVKPHCSPVQVDASVEVTDDEPRNAESEAEKSKLSPAKATVGLNQGPEPATELKAPQQQGPLKRLLSRLPFLPGRKEENKPPPPNESSHRGESPSSRYPNCNRCA